MNSLIVPLVRGAIAEAETIGKPAAWLVGLDFLAAWENEGTLLARTEIGEPRLTEDDIRARFPNRSVLFGGIGGIPYVVSKQTERRSAFLLDGQCRVLKKISAPEV